PARPGRLYGGPPPRRASRRGHEHLPARRRPRRDRLPTPPRPDPPHRRLPRPLPPGRPGRRRRARPLRPRPGAPALTPNPILRRPTWPTRTTRHPPEWRHPTWRPDPGQESPDNQGYDATMVRL